MMTIKDVPTRTPIPMVETSLSCDCESVKDRGRLPARKDATAITALKLSRVNKPAMIKRSRETPLSISAERYLHRLFILQEWAHF
jgi:hypothetical protein